MAKIFDLKLLQCPQGTSGADESRILSRLSCGVKNGWLSSIVIEVDGDDEEEENKRPAAKRPQPTKGGKAPAASGQKAAGKRAKLTAEKATAGAGLEAAAAASDLAAWCTMYKVPSELYQQFIVMAKKKPELGKGVERLVANVATGKLLLTMEPPYTVDTGSDGPSKPSFKSQSVFSATLRVLELQIHLRPF